MPPSADIFGKHKKKTKLHKRKSGLKQGAQVGHVGKGRKLLPNEDVDDTIVCLPKTTCGCGGHIQANISRFKRHQVFELSKIQPIVTEYQQVYGAVRNAKPIILAHCRPSLSRLRYKVGSLFIVAE